MRGRWYLILTKAGWDRVDCELVTMRMEQRRWVDNLAVENWLGFLFSKTIMFHVLAENGYVPTNLLKILTIYLSIDFFSTKSVKFWYIGFCFSKVKTAHIDFNGSSLKNLINLIIKKLSTDK